MKHKTRLDKFELFACFHSKITCTIESKACKLELWFYTIYTKIYNMYYILAPTSCQHASKCSLNCCWYEMHQEFFLFSFFYQSQTRKIEDNMENWDNERKLVSSSHDYLFYMQIVVWFSVQDVIKWNLNKQFRRIYHMQIIKLNGRILLDYMIVF